jgi:hypothetical protein
MNPEQLMNSVLDLQQDAQNDDFSYVGEDKWSPRPEE